MTARPDSRGLSAFYRFTIRLVVLLGVLTPVVPALAQADPDEAEVMRRMLRARNEAQRGDSAQDVGAIDFNPTNPISVDATGTGDLIITGTEEDLEAIRRLLEMLDQTPPEKTTIIHPLENASAEEVAQKLETVIEQLWPGSKDLPARSVSIIAVASNRLLITAPPERIERIVAIIDTIDEATDALPRITPMKFFIKHRRAAEVKEQLANVLTKLQAKQQAKPSEEITLEVNDADNSIIVFGPETLRERIQVFIDAIDVEPIKGFSALQLFIIPLRNTTAKAMADVLSEMLSSTSGQKDIQETIRRLSVVKRLPDGTRRTLAPLDLDRPIRILSDEATNSLIVATIEENFAPLEEIIQLLDGVPLGPEMNMKIFPLKFADAETVKSTLETMFDDGKKLPERAPGGTKTEAVPEGVTGKALVYNVGLTVDTRTNTLIVTGRPEQLVLAQLVVSELDVPVSSLKHPLRLLFVGEFVDASRAAALVRAFFDKRTEALEAVKAGTFAIERERVFVSVDPRSNALIISASDANLEEVKNIVAGLNVGSDRIVDGVRVINCQETNAADLKNKIDELWKRRGQIRSEADLPEDLPVIVADSRSNSLMIASSPEDFEEIQRLVQRLESQPLSPTAEIRLITLNYNDAKQTSEMLKSLFEERMQQRLASGQDPSPNDRVAIAVDEATNTLLIAASRQNYDEMLHILGTIDSEPILESVIRIFPLRNAEASRVADKIKELFDQGLHRPGGAAKSGVAEELQKLAVIADPRSNSIIASASRANLATVERLIQQMDGDFGTSIADETKIVALQYADAVSLAEKVTQLFELRKGEAADPELFRTPAVLADPRSNALIVSAPPDVLRSCIALIGQLDRPSGEPTAVFEVYTLRYGSAAKLAAKMQDLFDKRAEGRDEAVTPINIQADEASNSLIASAAREDHLLIRGLLDLLDKPSNIAKQFQIFPLKKAKAERVAETLDQLFQQQAEGAGGRADALAVQPDARSNSLVVWASPSEMDNIAAIVERLDTAKPAVEMMMRVIRLQQALAEDFAEILTSTLGGSDGDSENAVIIMFDQTMPDGSTARRRLLRQDITITPDPRTNSLMVMAPADSMDMLDAMIRDFDRIQPVTAEIRLFPLVNSDADEMVENLEEIFETGGTGADALDRALQVGGTGAAGAPGEGGVRQPLRFRADRRTNTVIASGNPIDLDMVEELILRLDAQEGDDRIHKVYHPKFAPAVELATALQEFNNAENELLSGLDDAISIRRRAEKQVTVVSDETSNSLLIGAHNKSYAQFMDLVSRIDRPEPQVMISVLIAEVSMDDRLEFGVEFAAQDLNFSEHAFVGNNGTIQGSGIDVVAGTDIGAAGVGFGGLSLTVSGEDFSFLFRALQSTGELEILSRPTILVQNNATGNITIGDRVPIITGSSSAGGQTSASVQYEDVGIILDVTPHINPDGYVTLDISPEISQISGQTVQVADGVTAVVISERSAQTTVTVKDGETVVLGGLITETRDRSERKVPFLGDVPWLGNLFKSKADITDKTELLIVLTVNVLRDENELREMSEREVERTGRFPARVRRSPLMEGLRISAEDDPFGPERDDREMIPLQGVMPARPQPDVYGPAPTHYGPPRPGATAQLPSPSRSSSSMVFGPRTVAGRRR